MKWIIVVMLVAIVGALAAAGVAMLRRPEDGSSRERRMARALAWRVGLSIALFLAVLLAWQFGWIRPTGLPAG